MHVMPIADGKKEFGGSDPRDGVVKESICHKIPFHGGNVDVAVDMLSIIIIAPMWCFEASPVSFRTVYGVAGRSSFPFSMLSGLHAKSARKCTEGIAATLAGCALYCVSYPMRDTVRTTAYTRSRVE